MIHTVCIRVVAFVRVVGVIPAIGFACLAALEFVAIAAVVRVWL
jgi:hypothetical protein